MKISWNISFWNSYFFNNKDKEHSLIERPYINDSLRFLANYRIYVRPCQFEVPGRPVGCKISF